jgi:hypothetical protein
LIGIARAKATLRPAKLSEKRNDRETKDSNDKFGAGVSRLILICTRSRPIRVGYFFRKVFPS